MKTAPARLFALVVPSPTPKVRHQVGMPKSLRPDDDPVMFPPARVLLIDEEVDGVFLLRYSAHAEFSGDTWHQDIAEAKEQAAFEFPPGPHWEPVPSDAGTTEEFVQLILTADEGGPRH